MKRRLIGCFIIGAISICGFSQSRENTTHTDYYDEYAKIDTIKKVISKNIEEIEEIKNSKQKIYKLSETLMNYQLLAEMWATRSNVWEIRCSVDKDKVETYLAILPLIKDDDSVFQDVLPSVENVPSSLKLHYDLLSQVIEVENDIHNVERTIENKTKACLEINQNPRDIIPNLILDDIQAIYSKIKRIKDSGLPTFSESQKSYFDNQIKGRYNNFEKYFTNE